MIRRPQRSTQGVSSAASDVYKRQEEKFEEEEKYINIQQQFFAACKYWKNHEGCNPKNSKNFEGSQESDARVRIRIYCLHHIKVRKINNPQSEGEHQKRNKKIHQWR
eukprot:TRINITY_DN32073_c0_g1_i1.p2 TRINITY_DN32073_c0_g1~~TRINITY_DN32073_c0_g1_i1.p2  ORF type:complete len:107 (+),score=16.70 TRINITY_DN32073_c0_g1_i1:98-418(+)